MDTKTEGDHFSVIGPPGAGKTSWLARQVERAVEKHGPETVAVLSYTRSAAAEVAGRDLPIPREAVGTLHSFCWRGRGRPEIAETSKHLADWNRDHPDLAVSHDTGSDPDEPMQEAGEMHPLARMNLLRARKDPPASWPTDVVRFAAEWSRWKEEQGLVDFTDLLEDPPPYCPGQPRILFVDEAQDLSALQLSVIDRWARDGGVQLVIVGDPLQAVYSFAGADPSLFFRGRKPIVLGQSYRLPRAVKAEAEAWVGGSPLAEGRVYEARDADGEVADMAARWKHPEAVVDVLGELKGTSMVLAVSSFMLEPLLAVLKREAIPFHNPLRRRRGDWNPLASQGERLRAIFAPVVHRRLWTAKELTTVADLVGAGTGFFVQGAKARLKEITREDGAEPLDTERLEQFVPMEQWMPLVRMMEDDKGAVRSWLLERCTTKRAQSSAFRFALDVVAKRGLDAALGTPSLVVGTIHSQKGGQADNVVLFPDLTRRFVLERDDPEELRRIWYVGMTRARERLLFANGSGRFDFRRHA